MRKIIIWGAGRLGTCAYCFFRDNYEVAYFVDSNSAKWGTYVNGIEVREPSTVVHFDGTVIVASRFDSEDIVKELIYKYKKSDIRVFDVIQDQVGAGVSKELSLENAISLRFSGGLGNQMFQYAVLCALRSLGKKVYVRNMNGMDRLEISKVFSGVHLETITSEDEKKLVSINIEKNHPNKVFAIYKENLSYGTVKKADEMILGIDSGIVQGIFQTRKFVESAKDELVQAFAFDSIKDKYLNQVESEICKNLSVAVHVRRGDYMIGNNKYLYGDICTEEYYKMSLNYMRNNLDRPIFYVFSNNLEEAKQLITGDDVKYVDGTKIDGYEDWYDMYLMTQCKHNIIANSTFSWWGAWLNQNEAKKVIAPNKWINSFVYKDIYPENWTIIE